MNFFQRFGANSQYGKWPRKSASQSLRLPAGQPTIVPTQLKGILRSTGSRPGGTAEILGGFGIIFVLFLIVLGILWTLLPFAVFGIKARLDETNRLLATVVRALGAEVNPAPKSELTPKEIADLSERYKQMSTDDLERLLNFSRDNLKTGTAELIEAELSGRS